MDSDEGLSATDAAFIMQKLRNNDFIVPVEYEPGKYVMNYMDTDGSGDVASNDSACLLYLCYDRE